MEHVMKTIETLANIPSPTGFTKQIITYIQAHLAEHNIASTKTKKGGLLVTLQGENNEKHRFLTGHVDTLGAMVKEVKGNGRLKLTKVGGFNWNAVEGENVLIHKADGETVSGTILMHQTSVHVYRNAGELARDDQNIEVRIDAEVHNADDLRKLGIEVGDFVSFEPRVVITPTGYIKSRHLDDKASVALLLELVKTIVKEENVLPYTTHILISNNEEIGYGGNSNIPDEVVEYIAVDMGAMGDGQTTDEYTVSICAKDSSGPYHYELRQQFVQLAKDNNIPYKIDIYPFYSSDASAAINAGYDIRHGLIGPGIESSHAYERTHVKSLQATYNLLQAYVFSTMID